jgi:hypothetical protein
MNFIFFKKISPMKIFLIIFERRLNNSSHSNEIYRLRKEIIFYPMKITSILFFTFVVLFHLNQVNSLECKATRDAIKNLKPQQLWVKFQKNT